MIRINPAHLSPAQARQAEYLAALAAWNAAKSRFTATAARRGKATLPDDALYKRVKELEPDWRESACSISEAERRTGVPGRTLAYYCKHAEELAHAHGIEVRCEKRTNGKRDEWYLCADDVIALRAAMKE